METLEFAQLSFVCNSFLNFLASLWPVVGDGMLEKDTLS